MILKQGSVIYRRELKSNILLVSIPAVLLGLDQEKYHYQLTMHNKPSDTSSYKVGQNQ